MKTIRFLIFVPVLFILVAGCTNEKDLLEGAWKRVIVENIHAGYTEEWHFIDGIITIKQICKENGSTDVLTAGNYRLKPVFNKTYLAVIFPDSSYIGYQADWEVLTLDREHLVIIHDELGGITQREFIKK